MDMDEQQGPARKAEVQEGNVDGKAQMVVDDDEADDSIDSMLMPTSIIKRIAKRKLPEKANIQKEALHGLCRSATLCISYITAAANDRAINAKRKTINPKDVLDALPQIEFDFMVPRMRKTLDRIQSDKKAPEEEVRDEETITDAKRVKLDNNEAATRNGPPTDVPFSGSDEQEQGIETKAGVDRLGAVDNDDNDDASDLEGGDEEADQASPSSDEVSNGEEDESDGDEASLKIPVIDNMDDAGNGDEEVRSVNESSSDDDIDPE